MHPDIIAGAVEAWTHIADLAVFISIVGWFLRPFLWCMR